MKRIAALLTKAPLKLSLRSGGLTCEFLGQDGTILPSQTFSGV